MTRESPGARSGTCITINCRACRDSVLSLLSGRSRFGLSVAGSVLASLSPVCPSMLPPPVADASPSFTARAAITYVLFGIGKQDSAALATEHTSFETDVEKEHHVEGFEKILAVPEMPESSASVWLKPEGGVNVD